MDFLVRYKTEITGNFIFILLICTKIAKYTPVFSSWKYPGSNAALCNEKQLEKVPATAAPKCYASSTAAVNNGALDPKRYGANKPKRTHQDLFWTLWLSRCRRPLSPLSRIVRCRTYTPPGWSLHATAPSPRTLSASVSPLRFRQAVFRVWLSFWRPQPPFLF